MDNIVLYSTNCPKCRILEQKLKDKNIKFSLINDEDLMIEKGFMTAPMLEVDDSIMNFTDAMGWVNDYE